LVEFYDWQKALFQVSVKKIDGKNILVLELVEKEKKVSFCIRPL
jgi:hypothetical protein